MKTELKVWLADLTYTGQDTQSLGADTFPLAVGCIATYSEQEIEFKDPIKIFRYPEKIAEALENEGVPNIMGFSNFIWNSELSLRFAQQIKKMSPKTIVVMGGPNFPHDHVKRETFLREHPEIDYFVVHEGEIAFVNLLKNLMAVNLEKEKITNKLPSVYFVNKEGEFVVSPVNAARIRDLTEIPSPYVTGKFDEFFDGKLWPLIQTKRGCPFTCTFCVEGIKYYTKIGRFSVDAVQEEIEYIGKKMEVVRLQGGRNDLYIADSNFGMYKEDLEACKALAQTQKIYGWPDHINASTGKNNKEKVLEAARVVNGSIVLSGSVQSLDKVVLENIKRKNISADDLMSLAKEADNVDANSYCEIILGLPGDSKETHLETLKTVVTAGFNKVIPYQLMILSGSELGANETVEKYNMSIRSRVLPRAFGSYDVCGETIVSADIEDVCVATNTMSFEDYMDCRVMHLVIGIFFNDVVFETVLKALTVYNMSSFRWLELIKDCVSETRLASLFDEFRKCTDEELWVDRKELEAFIQKEGTMDRYIRGELGFNLFYTFKANALVKYLDAVIEVVETAISLLIKEVHGQNDELEAFFETIIQWDGNRIQSIVLGLENKVECTMDYDIGSFADDIETKPIIEYFYNDPVHLRYELTDEQKESVRCSLSVFGDDAPGIGRLLSTVYTKKLLRNPVQI